MDGERYSVYHGSFFDEHVVASEVSAMEVSRTSMYVTVHVRRADQSIGFRGV